VFGAVAYGIKEGPQPFGIVTLQTQTEEVEVRKNEKKRKTREILIRFGWNNRKVKI